MNKNISLTTQDGHTLSAYENKAKDSSKAVIIIQEIFGVNEHIRAVVDHYASLGFHAIAPALFDRVEPNVELDYSDDSVNKGRELRNQLSWDNCLFDIRAALDHLKQAGYAEISVIGYCFGGSLAWLSATRLDGLKASVSYYGGQVVEFINETPRCAVQFFFGGQDPMIPQSDIDQIKAAHPTLPVIVFI